MPWNSVADGHAQADLRAEDLLCLIPKGTPPAMFTAAQLAALAKIIVSRR